MSDEFTRMIRAWGDGLFVYMTMVDQFVTQGVAIGYYKDKIDWQWQAAGLREFKFPRRTKATSGDVEVATCEVQLSPSELAENIQDEDFAKEQGWDVQEVKRVLKSSSSDLYDDQSPEDQQEREKANDYDDDINPFDVVNLVYAWVKEMDGTVSFYITTKADSESTDRATKSFLFESPSMYDNMAQAIHIFPYYTGNRGNIYTIRGLGYMTYAQDMASNLMQCSMLDSARDSMSVKYIANSEKGITSIPIINAGPYSLVPPSLALVADQKAPDLQRSAMPAIELLNAQSDRRSSSSSLSNVFNNAPDRRSSSEAMAAVEHFSSINSAAMLLWSRPWRDLIIESLSRAFASNQNDQIDSGKMAEEMQQACLQRGVPPEAFNQINLRLSKTSIPVGPGSKAARAAVNQQGARLYTSMDVPGREAFDRDQAIEIFGPEKANEYINFGDGPRETHDHAIARLENNDLLESKEVQPSPSENFMVHLGEHVPVMVQYIQAVEEGQMELTDATRDILEVFKHSVATFEMAVVPELLIPELASYKQQLQQIGEYINNGMRAIAKEERENAEAQQQQGGGDDGEANAEDEKSFREEDRKESEHTAKMRRDAESFSQRINQDNVAFENEMAQKRADSIQKNALADAAAVSKLSQ